MNKNVLMLFAFFIGIISFAQQERALKINKDTNLIDVVYYHDNGVISQLGSYTLDGKLHGEWFSFDTDGNKSVAANYDNGKKVGKWFYWTDKTLKEVDYTNNAIVSISDWQKDSKKSVAIRN
ncbi:MAG: nicotinic acid mononucleotide adenyltransferase [Winogradskyella sp.]|uniref:toxin-antitoxin system YwqK family antitoxin n=1 Tax=Winogradskyella sp. TaxID=1883156 RepID=UPI0017F1C69D|nr:nicotinic acid mononucleotide adenyltransferase [Winogradskyella sp.]